MLLLIDNCSLLQLVYSAGYSQQLVELENYINLGHVSLLTHTCILSEWEKHKAEDKKRKTNRLLKGREVENAVGTIQLPGPVPANLQHLDSQYEQIDRLLNKALVLSTPDYILAEYLERKAKKLAPMRREKDAKSDWEIIGSAGDYAQLNSIQHFYFVSNNSRDFASTSEPKKTIHSDIQERFNGVEIRYSKELLYFLLEMAQLILPQKQLLYNIVRNEKFTHKAGIKQNDIDSLYYLFKDNYGEIAFIPRHILRKCFPLANAVNSYTHTGLFNMSYVRWQFVDLMENVQIETDHILVNNAALFSDIKDYEEKIRYILKRLTNNLIFNLSSEKATKTVSVLYRSSQLCGCIRCNYQALEFHRAFAQLRESPDGLLDKLKVAYISYQLGNLSSSAKLLLDLRDEALQANKFMIYFICLYNLNQLGSFLADSLTESILTPEEMKQLVEIDPLEESVKLKSYTDYDFVAFVASGDFFHDALDTISGVVLDIEDHYNAHLRGGRGSNSFAWKLVSEFATLDSFINNNCIIYDSYSNFDRLFELVTKGLFASHALRGSQSSFFEAFDDYWVSKFIFYGEKKIIYKYFNRYKLTDLTYKANSIHPDTFMQLAENLLCYEVQVREKFELHSDRDNYRFYDKYHRVLDNLLTMATLLDLKPANINKFFKLLYGLITTEKSLTTRNYDTIAGLIKTKGKYMDKRLFKRYISYFTTNLQKYEPGALDALLSIYPDHSLKDYAYGPVLDLALHSLEIYKRQPAVDLLITIYKKSTDKVRSEISIAIQQQLEANFEFHLYYFSLMYGLIPLNKKTLFQQLEQIPVVDKDSQVITGLSGFRGDYNYHLDKLINICFKHRISTRSAQLRRLHQVNDYYCWLMDMEAFNYEYFKFEWVYHYGTDAYYSVMSKSKKLRRVIVEHLRTHSDEQLEKALIKMSYFAK